MNEYPRFREFEKFAGKLFSEYQIENELNKFFGDSEVDIVLKRKDGSMVFVEVKIYRSRIIHISQIKKGLDRLNSVTNEQNADHGLLVISSIIDTEIKNSLETRYGITIWDRGTLFNLTRDSPDLREEFENILRRISEDENEGLFSEIGNQNIDYQIGNIWKLSPNQVPSLPNRGKSICHELKNIPAGRDDFKSFELKCEETLKYIFDNDLTAWHHQARTDDGLSQFDLICRIFSTHDFWKSLSRNFNSRYVLFEFKNYSSPIKQGQIYTTEKYLFIKALRSIGFIIAKNGAEENATTAMKGALREHGKLMICLTPEDLCEMLKLKDKGDDPNSYLAERVDEFLIRLSR